MKTLAAIVAVFIMTARESSAGWMVQPITPADGTAAFSFTLDKIGQPRLSWFSGSELNYSEVTNSSWTTHAIEKLGYMVKGDNSITIDKRNYPRISYCDENTQSLKYAEWTGMSWSTYTVDTVTGEYKLPIGAYNSIMLDTENHPCISYYDENTQSLKYAKWAGETWSINNIDSGQIGYPSLKLDSHNRPRISYCDVTGKTLKYAEWVETLWSTQTIDSGGDIGQFSTILLGKDDAPQIFYYAVAEDQMLKYANWGGSSWRSFRLKRAKRSDNLWKTDVLDLKGSTPSYTSIVLDKDDYPHIAYTDSIAKIVNYTKWTGKSWRIQPVAKAGSNSRPILTLDNKGRPRIVYYDSDDKRLKYAILE